VLEVEHRRKSGREVEETFFIPPPSLPSSDAKDSKIILLDDHPLYHPRIDPVQEGVEEGEAGTFELGLTEKQRRDREGVVLPYFDAQRGGGEGGRIFYEMGAEDDFDEEEDEI